MAYWSPLPSARRHPSLTFGLSGGLFALLFVVAASARQLLDGQFAPSGPETGLVVGGFVGGALVARLLWARLDAPSSPLRGAAVGALIGLLALPVPMYVLELGVVAFDGIPFDPRPGATPWAQVARYAYLLLATPLILGAVGVFVTRGGTVVLGAATGYLLARR